SGKRPPKCEHSGGESEKPVNSGAIARTDGVNAAICGLCLTKNSPGKQFPQTALELHFSRYALSLRPFAHRDYRLRHIAMASGITDIVEQPLDQVACVSASKAIMTNCDNQVRPQLAGDGNPLHAFELQTEIRDLYNQIVTLNLAQINRDQAVADFQPAHR